MSNFQTLTPATGGITGTGPQLFSAVTSDTLAVLTTAGYLNDLGKILKQNDIVWCNYLDTSLQPVGGVLTHGEVSLLGQFSVNLVGANLNMSLISSYVGGFNLKSTTNGITAFAGGGQTNAVPLTSAINRVTVVATAADSVKLPQAVAGMSLTVINAAAANAMNVYPFLGDSINALAVNTPFSEAANKSMIYDCAVAGIWNSNLTA